MVSAIGSRQTAGALFAPDNAVVHVRFAGQSFDIPLASLDVGAESADLAIKAAVANWLKVPAGRLDGCVIDRHANGNLTVRPEAVFG
jgi:hypothetical protein